MKGVIMRKVLGVLSASAMLVALLSTSVGQLRSWSAPQSEWRLRIELWPQLRLPVRLPSRLERPSLRS
jgi:hypothetical protein